MYKFTNLSQKYNRLSVSGHFKNLQLLNLVKDDIYPHFNNYIKNNKQTNILINSGKILINFKKEIKKESESKSNFTKTLFAEPTILCEKNNINNNEYTNSGYTNSGYTGYTGYTEYTNFYDSVNVLTNRTYILTVFPNVYFSFYSYDKNSSLILLE